ncbi:hypothetical protein GQ55_4G332300 [Panicum hallii var. hallii]|uniref:Bifunctional inhibitor/plant lipid transfer protein/seed storage helical domain-containing protein n=1 Tax=Panicum hallii var. hallii TaxID=1504633 RepID=A0A2T7E2P5_9POAL|nr:hypothetical protein GQ55_4G332300 [Panicum hallii var. hallii]
MISVPTIGNNSKLANYSWESPKEHSICNPAGDLTINRISKAPSHPRRRLRSISSPMAPARHASSAIMAAAAVALLAVLAVARDHDACETAQQAFSECVPYVVGQAPAASPHCCTGLGDLRDMGGGGVAAQRRALCACVLSEVKAAGEMDPRRAAGLAAACKVPVGFVPSKPDFNCSAVQ